MCVCRGQAAVQTWLRAAHLALNLRLTWEETTEWGFWENGGRPLGDLLLRLFRAHQHGCVPRKARNLRYALRGHSAPRRFGAWSRPCEAGLQPRPGPCDTGLQPRPGPSHAGLQPRPGPCDAGRRSGPAHAHVRSLLFPSPRPGGWVGYSRSLALEKASAGSGRHG